MRVGALIALAISSALPAAAQLRVVGVEPPLHALAASPRAVIRVHFDRPVDPATLPPSVASLHVSGSTSGPLSGSIAYENGDQTLRFSAARAFAAGEQVEVRLSRDVGATDGTVLRRAGWTWRFRVAARSAPMSFQQIDDLFLRTQPTTTVRIYGAYACDLDGDGFVDLSMICEDSSDLRVVMNRADATGRFVPDFLAPYATGATPSPNDAGDFDGDGRIDFAIANVGGGTVTIALGNGDGTFAPRQDYPAGTGPTGLVAFDVDGDGDQDLVTANSVGDDLALLLGDGSGAFAAPVHFESGGSGEHGLAVEDMNDDGILDLVVGARYSQRVFVLLSAGNGTFAPSASVYCGGAVWNVTPADVNGDGLMDVTAANGLSNSGAILFGDGAGHLAPAVVVPAAGFTVASDLGDLDGDGDLDWMLSNHLGGTWRLYENIGAGQLVFRQEFTALSNPACAVMTDVDGDRDLDLVLLDEIADHAFIWRNGTGPATSFCSGDADELDCPCGNSGANGQGCSSSVNGAGALLAASGGTNPDTITLDATGLPPSALAIFLAGDALAAPSPFGDGIVCTGGFLRRFGRQTAQMGAAAFPRTGLPSLSNASGTTSGSGALRLYQVYYRNAAAGFCTSATFNTTNGLALVW